MQQEILKNGNEGGAWKALGLEETELRNQGDRDNQSLQDRVPWKRQLHSDSLEYSGEHGSVYANQQTTLKSQHVSLYSVRISFKTEGNIKFFSDI